MGLALVGLGPVIASAYEQAPSPSPTLGSTTSTHPNPPGSKNSSPQDYNGAIWAVVGAVVVVAIVGAGTFYLTRTRRIDLSQRSTPEDERRAARERSKDDHRM